MAKPIFIIKMPHSSWTEPQDDEKVKEDQKGIAEKLSDYHVLFVSHDKPDAEFQMFSDKEIEPIELEKLKEELNLIQK